MRRSTPPRRPPIEPSPTARGARCEASSRPMYDARVYRRYQSKLNIAIG